MNSRPFVIAIVLTLLSAIPLYFLGSGGFQITTANFPILALSLFILLLIAAYWAATAKHKDIVEHTGVELSGDSKAAGDESRETGNVKWFNANKGFGFITRDSGDDVFVHFRSIRGSGRRVLRDGQRVEFAIVESDKGLQAEDVAVAS